MMAVILTFCHVGFRHLVFFSQIHSKTLSLHTDSWLKLIQSDSNLFILTQLDDRSHLEFCHLEFRQWHLGFSHLLSFASQTHSHLPRLVPIHSDTNSNLHSFILTQLDDASHLEFYHVGLRKLHCIHSESTWWWQSSWILPCWIQTLCFLLSDSLKNTLTPLWLWLKVIQSDWNLIHSQLNLMMAGILNLAILDSAILVVPLKLTHTCQDWFPPFAQIKPSLIHSDSTWWWQPSWIPPCSFKNLHSFILTQLEDGSHLEFYHVGFRHLLIFSQIHSKTLSLYSDSDSN